MSTSLSSTITENFISELLISLILTLLSDKASYTSFATSGLPNIPQPTKETLPQFGVKVTSYSSPKIFLILSISSSFTVNENSLSPTLWPITSTGIPLLANFVNTE